MASNLVSYTKDDIDREFPVKVELHVHLEGAVRFETILELSKERNVTPPANTVEELKKYVCVYKAEDLTSALENLFIIGPSFAGYHEGVYRIALEFCEDAAKHGIYYSELRYSPQFLSNSQKMRTYAAETEGDYTPRDVVRSVNQALKDGAQRYGVIVNTILCCVRHYPEWSKEVVDLCAEFADQGVVAMDIAGPEVGSIVDSADQSLHLAAFQEAKRRGIPCIAHAGEVGPAETVRMSVDDYGAVRVGHGYRSLEDPALYQRLLKQDVHFETCPLSSLVTKGWQAPAEDCKHPILQFAKDGADFSINSDDPTLWDNTLTKDYICALEMGLSKELLITSIFNAARASFASKEVKEQVLSKLTAAYGAH